MAGLLLSVIMPFLFLQATTSGSSELPASERERAESFLETHAVIDLLPTRPDAFESISRQVSQTPDPKSKFGYLVFSIARHGEKLLTPPQVADLDALVEKRKSAPIDWHDVRNLVRVRAQLALWDYAAETNPDHALPLRRQWDAWTDLRLAYMLQEFVATERFQRAAWEILTDDQRRSLRSGAWDSHLRKRTGHRRLFSADKQIARVLGKPDFPDAFTDQEAAWRKRWDAMWTRYQAAATFERKRESSMNLADEAFAIHAWNDRYAPAFRAFVVHECEAIRDLLQAGYRLDDEARRALANHRETLRNEALDRYAECPAEMLALLKPDR